MARECLPWPSLRRRSQCFELIDGDVAELEVLAESYRDMERYNALFGGIEPVRRVARERRPQTLIDVGCGTAGLARVLAKDALRHGFPLAITCVDSNPAVLRLAAHGARALPNLRFFQADGQRLPYGDRSFDVATCTLTIHHCDAAAAVLLLAELRRLAQYPIVADLRRCAGGLAGAYLIANVLSQNPLTRHDAPLSVRRAYTATELSAMARSAGWKNPRVRHTAFFRMLLTDAE